MQTTRAAAVFMVMASWRKNGRGDAGLSYEPLPRPRKENDGVPVHASRYRFQVGMLDVHAGPEFAGPPAIDKLTSRMGRYVALRIKSDLLKPRFDLGGG